MIREGSLVVLIGPAGSGKSTLAATRFPAEAVLSSDAFRAALGSSEADQGATPAAFAALHRAIEKRLWARQTGVVDATNLTSGARRSLLLIAGRLDADAVALVLDLPADVVLERNARRALRVVPDAVVRRHLALLAGITDDMLRDEGFDEVRRFTSKAAVEASRP